MPSSCSSTRGSAPTQIRLSHGKSFVGGRRLGIEPVPDDLKEAREAVFNTHVNLVDLTEGNESARKLVIFETERELARYSARKGRYMPSDSPMVGGVLRALLRFLKNPPEEDLKRDQFGRYVRRGEKTVK